MTLDELHNLVQTETERVRRTLQMDTLSGRQRAIALYESTYNDSFHSGVNVAHSLARLNVLRTIEGKPPIC